MMSLAVFTLTAAAPTAPARPPMQKKGPLAWDNASEADCLRRGAPLRLVVHRVNDKTNYEYLAEVKVFIQRVITLRLPFSTDEEKDVTMAKELERMCFVLGCPVGRGQKLLHGWCHVFPECRGKLPISLRSLHTWESLKGSAEGGPACRESVHVMSEALMKKGRVDEAIAVEIALDGYLREQDWAQLRAEDVMTDWRDGGICSTALLFGRRHRGESVKTGQEQGVQLESPLLRRLMAERARLLNPDDKMFDTNPDVFRRHWRAAASSLDMPWFPPPHCLRHTGPSEDAASGRKTLEDIRRRGRWTQPKSVQRYSKPHALTIHKSRLDSNTKAHGRHLEQNFLQMLVDTMPPGSSWAPVLAATVKSCAGRHPLVLR